MADSYRVLTLNSISNVGLKRFPAKRYKVGSQIAEPDAVLVRSHDMHRMDIPTTVRAIARAGAGTNNIPIRDMSGRGVPVFNAPGANANAVKELVIAAMLIAARNLVPAFKFVEGLRGDDATLHKAVEDGKKAFVGTELPRHTLGILGLGKVGSLVADAAIKLGMNVVGFDPEITVDAAWRLPSSVHKAHSVEELLKRADFVTLHVPLLPVTRHMIDAARLAAMKPGSVLLNFARDALVDDEAVKAALRRGHLKCYVCDFPTAALKSEPGVVALPHLGASTEEAEVNSAVMVVDEVRAFLENGTIANAVNFPNVDMMRESPYRVAIANSNVPNMLGQISLAMGHGGLNIHNMVNKSRGEMAYTLVDVDSPVPEAAVASIAAIEGVLSVRAIPSEG
jgi:D-3-phosphoglycerate dehydrogenase